MSVGEAFQCVNRRVVYDKITGVVVQDAEIRSAPSHHAKLNVVVGEDG